MRVAGRCWLPDKIWRESQDNIHINHWDHSTSLTYHPLWSQRVCHVPFSWHRIEMWYFTELTKFTRMVCCICALHFSLSLSILSAFPFPSIVPQTPIRAFSLSASYCVRPSFVLIISIIQPSLMIHMSVSTALLNILFRFT